MTVIRTDGPCALSDSVLWKAQRGFYEREGPAAFLSGTVPWRITSSLLLASAYADAAVAFGEGRRGALQILELGGGVGRLAFHLMRELDARGAEFRYHFTDAAPASVDAVKRHPQLLPWMDRGLLSARVLDALVPSGLDLPDGPVVVIANYLFDSLPHDAWRADAGKARGQHVEVWAPTEDAPLHALEWRFVEAPDVPVPPALAGYAARVGSGRFLWPTRSLAAVNAIAARLRRPHLWLIADKGPAALAAISGRDSIALARHGCVSASVNFDAVRAWAGWRPFLAPFESTDRFGVFGLVQGTRDVGPLARAWESSVGQNAALQAEVLLEQLVTASAPVPQLLQALAFTRFDPDALLRVAGLLRAQLSAATPGDQVAALFAAVDATWANRFVLAEPHDLAFEIGTLLHRAGQLSGAAGYYRRSIELRGPHATTFFNLALCLLDLGQVPAAKRALESTLAADAAHARARALLAAV